jgi:MFS family permease
LAGVTRLGDLPGYRRFWAASTASSFGTPVTAFAIQILTLETLHASTTELGLVSAARWTPYLVLGLVVGVLIDRYRRRPVLVGADLGRAVLLCALPVLALTARLTVAVLALVVLLFGVLSLLFDAADQSFLPRLVPGPLLTAANARLEQADAAAQTTGPLLASALIRLVGAPLAILVDAASYLVSGLLLASLRITEPAPRPRQQRRPVRAELREGLAYVYRHRMLAPQAVSTHLWFLANSVLSTVYPAYALRELRLGEFWLGATLACAGVGAVLGGAFAERAGQRFGAGRTIIAGHAVMPVAWVLVPLASPAVAVALLGAAQFTSWLAMGASGPNEMAYRQTVTPDRLQGRVNTSIRSVNRGVIVLGAPLGGLLADTAGYRVALWVGIAGLASAALVLVCSPFRRATVPTDALNPAND